MNTYKNVNFKDLMSDLRNDGQDLIISEPIPSAEKMKETMMKYIEALNENDIERKNQLFSEIRAERCIGVDPVGSYPGNVSDIGRLTNVPFRPYKAELNAPISLTFSNRGAMPFKFYAEVDGQKLTIDIVDIMTFDAQGKIVSIEAYWGKENVTFIDEE